MKRLILIILLFLYFEKCVTAPKKSKPNLPSSWSNYQGQMFWDDAMEKCNNIQMRLPTIEELKFADKDGVTKSWHKDGLVYWTSEEEWFSYAYNVGLAFRSYSLGVNSYWKNNNLHVRCIR